MLLPWEITKNTSGKKAYESLHEVKERAEASLNEYIQAMDTMISKDKEYLSTYYSRKSNCGAYQCYGGCRIGYTLLVAKVQDTKDQIRSTVKAIGHVERALLLYRNMTNAIKRELGPGDEEPEKESFEDIAQRYENNASRLKLFGKLEERIVVEGTCPHG